jgi:glycosyltransferase involved in cell wall biosynthesis
MNPNVLLIGNFLSASVLTRAVGEDLATRLADRGYAVRTTSSLRPRVARLLDMIATVLRDRDRYDIAQVDLYSGPAFLYAEVVVGLLRLLRKPHVLTLHGGNLPAFGRRWPRRVGRLLRGATAVTTPSRYLLEWMRQYRSDIYLLPNAVDVSAYHFRVRERPRPRLVWLRAFHRMYNPMLAPAVAARISAGFPGAQLTMIGPDKEDGSQQDTERVAAAVQMRDRVAFAGAVQKREVPAWLDESDVFLNTTDVDNAPVSVVEAMAAGLCIVSTNVGGIPYLLEHEQDALLVPPRDEEAMARAVVRILTEPGLAARLSRNARAKAEQLDWAVILPKWEQLLASVARRNGS